MDKFKDVNQYKQYLQNLTNNIFGDREKVSKREIFTVFKDQIGNLNSQGLKRLDNIFAMDGDGTTVSKEELMTAYSLLDMDISKNTPDGELNAESSVLNNANDKEFEQLRDSVSSAYKEVKQPKQKRDKKPDITPTDSARVKIKFADDQEFNPDDYTLEALKKRFPEPEYTVYQEEAFIVGMSPQIIVKKDGKEVARVLNDEGDIGVSLTKYDEHGNTTSKIFLKNGNVTEVKENKYTYDKRGNITSEFRYKNGKLKYGTYKEYDEYNNVTFQADLDGNKKTIHTTETTYNSYKIYYVKDKNGELISASAYEIYDTQEEVEDIRSQGGTAYLRSKVDSVDVVSYETSKIGRDANGNVIEEYRQSEWDEDTGKEIEGIDSHSPLADEIYAAVSAKNSLGLPTTDIEGLKKAIEKVHPSNIQCVLYYYKETYGQDLLSAIKEEWGARITNKKEIDGILDKLKSIIITSGSYNQVYGYLVEAFSGIPDTKFIEDAIKSNNFNPIIADDYFEEHTGKSLIQTIMDKNLTISLEKRAELIRHIIDQYIGTEEDYGGNAKFDLKGYRKAAYDELDRQLNKFGTMDATKLDDILQNKPLNTNYKDPNMPNGKIDKIFAQKYSGDCWLISAIMAIALTKNADKYFSDILTLTDSGSVEVRLKGVKKTYIITKQDIIYGGFFKGSKGDGDVKAIEKAFEDYLVETGRKKDVTLDGGTIYDAFLALLGEEKFKCYNINKLSVDFIKNEFGAENNATIISRYEDGNHAINKAYKADGTEIELVTKHGWAISRTDDKYVYFIDPNVGTEEYHISIEDFKKAFDTCAVATLD